jgi:hypothetical protein
MDWGIEIMAAEPQSIWDALSALVAKWLPAVAGSAISLRFVPAGSSRAHVATTLLGGIVAAVFAGPAVAEVFEATPKLEAAIVFTCGLFGLAAIGQAWVGLKDLQIGQLARDVLRKWFGVGGGQP